MIHQVDYNPAVSFLLGEMGLSLLPLPELGPSIFQSCSNNSSGVTIPRLTIPSGKNNFLET
jgi:hypothetical protein